MTPTALPASLLNECGGGVKKAFYGGGSDQKNLPRYFSAVEPKVSGVQPCHSIRGIVRVPIGPHF